MKSNQDKIDSVLKRNDEMLKRNNELLIEAIDRVKPYRNLLLKELNEGWSQERFDKFTNADNEIKKAESLLGVTPREGSKLFALYHPDKVNEDGKINEKGKKRLNFFTRLFLD